MKVLRFRTTVLVGDVLWNPVHRTRAIERDERNDILETRRLQLRADALHTLRLELKDAHRLTATQHLERFMVVDRNFGEIEPLVDRAPYLPYGIFHHRQIAQPEEIHLEQTDPLDPIHVVLSIDCLLYTSRCV